MCLWRKSGGTLLYKIEVRVEATTDLQAIIELLKFDIERAIYHLERGETLLGIKWLYNLAEDYLFVYEIMKEAKDEN
jgi:hypothetical protein